MRLLVALVLFAFSHPGAGALRYLPANDSRPLLQRHHLPLDIDFMAELAGHLALLADGPFPNSAPELHHRARALTLSQRLHPGHERAGLIEAALLEKKNRPLPDPEAQKAALETVITTADWLTQLPPDSEGQRLGQLLLDLIAPRAPDHPVLKRRAPADSTDPWNGTVANVADFEYQEKTDPLKNPEFVEATRKSYEISALLTEVPMIGRAAGRDAISPDLVTTSLVITPTRLLEDTGDKPPGRAPGALLIKPEAAIDADSTHGFLVRLFATHLEPLPAGYNLNINTDRHHYLGENGDNLTAPIAMMLDSASTGRTLRHDTILFARLGPDGDLLPPARAWELLLELDQHKASTKSRLVLAPGLHEELTGLLVLHKASFFTRYEVLEASTLAEARELYFEDGQMPEPLQVARKGYLEVRQKADQSNNLGSFLSLTSVETRLVQASAQSPRHLSAKMLATQAERRPNYFSSVIAARDLDRRLAPLHRFQFDYEKTSADDLKSAYQAARTLLEPMEKLLWTPEKPLFNEAIKLSRSIQTVGNDLPLSAENREERWHDQVQAFQQALGDFRRKLREIAETAPQSGQ